MWINLSRSRRQEPFAVMIVAGAYKGRCGAGSWRIPIKLQRTWLQCTRIKGSTLTQSHFVGVSLEIKEKGLAAKQLPVSADSLAAHFPCVAENWSRARSG